VDPCDVSRLVDGNARQSMIAGLFVEQGKRAQWVNQPDGRGPAFGPHFGDVLGELRLRVRVRRGKLGLREQAAG